MEQPLILDRYRPLEDLGAGGFGDVVLAWDTRMQRRVAIKRMPLPVDEFGHPITAAGLAEARTAALLNHPAIVTVHDWATDDDEAFIIMEFVDGASLAELLDDVDGPLDVDEAAAVLEPVAEALSFAHDNGVLHLDIKPDNVLVTRDGRVKVTDFGVSALSSLSGRGDSSGGTLGYMPPEQLHGAPVDERTDAWAFGTLAYETLTGANPFAAIDMSGAIRVAEGNEPTPASTLNRTLPAEVDDVLWDATAAYAPNRTRTVERVAAELLPLLGDASEGREKLAELVAPFVAEEEARAEVAEAGLGLWDRLGTWRSVWLRAAAGGGAAWFAWAGLTGASLEPAPLWGVVALAALAGIVAPALGAALALGIFLAGFALNGFVIAAVTAGVLTLALWWMALRRSSLAATLPLLAPFVGVASAPFALPLIAGFALPAAQAAAAALLAGALVSLFAAMSGSGAPYAIVDARLLGDVWRASVMTDAVARLAAPAPAVALASWPLAAAASSLLSRRSTRLSAAAGALAGAGVLAGGLFAASLLAPAPEGPAWIGYAARVAGGVSLILITLVIVAGPPVRGEDGPAPSRRRATREGRV